SQESPAERSIGPLSSPIAESPGPFQPSRGRVCAGSGTDANSSGEATAGGPRRAGGSKAPPSRMRAVLPEDGLRRSMMLAHRGADPDGKVLGRGAVGLVEVQRDGVHRGARNAPEGAHGSRAEL